MKELEAWLRELDERRYSDPEGVRAELLGKAEEMPAELVPLWCGVAGSCLRLMERYEEAKVVLEEGLRWADERLDHVAAGELHQRLSNTLWDVFEFKPALVENAKAISRYVEGRTDTGVAKALVDRGVIFGLQGRFTRSTQSFELALEMLPEELPRSRAAAHHGCAVNYLEDGDLVEAVQHLNHACCLQLDPLNQGKLYWSIGNAFLEGMAFQEAEKAFLEAMRLLEETAPVDYLLVLIDLLRMHLWSGQVGRAHELASYGTSLVGELRNQRAAQAVAIELSTIGLRGRGLTRDLLQSFRARVRENARR